jgi:hypothetical protein
LRTGVTGVAAVKDVLHAGVVDGTKLLAFSLEWGLHTAVGGTALDGPSDGPRLFAPRVLAPRLLGPVLGAELRAAKATSSRIAGPLPIPPPASPSAAAPRRRANNEGPSASDVSRPKPIPFPPSPSGCPSACDRPCPASSGPGLAFVSLFASSDAPIVTTQQMSSPTPNKSFCVGFETGIRVQRSGVG